MDGLEPARSIVVRSRWRASLGLGLGLFVLYSANCHTTQVHDTEGAVLLPVALLRGDGPYLDRFDRYFRDDSGALEWNVESWRGHLVSRYPPGPAVVAIPFTLPQLLVLDRLQSGWDRGPRAHFWAALMAKNTSAAIAALVGVALYHLLMRLGLARVALATALAAGLGTNLWAVASQAPWQHGPAALALTLALLWLSHPEPSRARLLLAGVAAAAVVALRSIDVVFAAAVALWVARHEPRRLGWFLPGPIVLGAAVIAFNLTIFGTLEGGQSRLEALHPAHHGTRGPWSGDLLDGLAGTLFSPSRGLFVFTPWLALALGIAPRATERLPARTPVRWALWALVPFGLLVSKYAVWWAGHSFGPRYWTDAVPLFAVLLGCGLDWVRQRGPFWRGLFAITVAWSIGVQAIGALCYPSSWNERPNIDLHHERLWDWRDTELSRCLTEGVNPRLRQVAEALGRRLAKTVGP